MDPLSVSASIVALVELTSNVVRYLSDVKDGPKELQRIRLEVASLPTLLFILQDHAIQTKQGDSFFSTLNSLNGKNGPLEQLRTTLGCIAKKMGPAQGMRKISKPFKWPFDKKEIHNFLNMIERQKALLGLALQNDHIALSKAIRDDQKTMHKRVEDVTEGLCDLQIGESQERIRRWLSAPDPSSNFNRALKAHHPDTGDWFLESDAYKRWLSEPGSFLALYGIPGCGKTVLSSTIIHNTVECCQSRSSSIVLYFFFDFNDVEKQGHEKMIRSLIQQLFSQCATASPVLESLYSSCTNGGRQPTYDALLTSLHRILKDLDGIYIILDALDECAEIHDVLTDIGELVAWKDVNLHILTTSRREKDIEPSMDLLNGGLEKFDIKGSLVNHDIRVYIHNRLTTDRALKRWQNQRSIQQEIEDTLMEKADGM